MKLTVKSVVVGAAALATTAGFMLAAATTASAAPPSYEPDPSAVGTISFFDATGNPITSGAVTDSPLAAYYQASGGGVAAGDNLASIAYATPQDGVPTASWTTVETWTSTQGFPNATYPGQLGTSPNAVVKGATTDGGLDGHIAAFPSASTTNPGVYQIRMYTNHAGGSGNPTYYSADVLVSGSTWTQVYPAVAAATGTTTTLNVTPASPQATGTNVTLSATVAAASGPVPTNGTVQFFDGATQLGATQNWTGSAVSVQTSTLSVGTHSLTAKYIPSGTTFSGSTSAPKSYTITGVAAPTTTALAVNPGTSVAFTPVQLTATVTPSSAPGKVTFSDSVAGNLGTTAAGAGTFTFSTSALGAGAHTITATFNATDSSAFGTSTSTSTPFTLTAPTTAPDPQTVTVNVPAGTLTITTPYTPTSPFSLGDLALNTAGTSLHASGTFGDAANPANGVTITDTRAGDLQWTAAASSTDFTKGSDSIDATNFGLTGVTPNYVAGNALNATTKPVVAVDVPAGTPGLKGGPHQFASAAHGVGTVYVDGTLSLDAPTSTVAGLYTATLTFTIS
jgi:hypothetical protein